MRRAKACRPPTKRSSVPPWNNICPRPTGPSWTPRPAFTRSRLTATSSSIDRTRRSSWRRRAPATDSSSRRWSEKSSPISPRPARQRTTSRASGWGGSIGPRSPDERSESRELTSRISLRSYGLHGLEARTEPGAKRDEARLVLAERAIDQIPGPAFGNGQPKRRHQPPGRDVVLHIGAQRHCHADAVDRRLQPHGVVVEARAEHVPAEPHPRRRQPQRPFFRRMHDLEQRLPGEIRRIG